MQRKFTKVRIFISTPSDVPEERESLEGIIKDIEREWGNVLLVTLEPLDWHTVAPGMGRAEDVILEQLPVGQWDIYIGILRNRFGTPTGKRDPDTGREFKSGTEEEFKLAYRSWHQTHHPHIMFYRCKRPPRTNDERELDLEQMARVRQFFANFDSVEGDNPGYVTDYYSVDEFRRHVRLDIVSTLNRYFGKHINPNPPGASNKFRPRERGNIPPPLIEPSIPLPPDRNTQPQHIQSLKNEETRGTPSLSEDVREQALARLRPDEPPAQLLGRGEFLREVSDTVLLGGNLPYLLYGMPGSGKTAAMMTLVRMPEILAQFGEENIFWIDMRGLRPLVGTELTDDMKEQIADEMKGELADVIARALNYPGVLTETRPVQKLRALGGALRRHRPRHLFILDNADHDVQKEVIQAIIRHVSQSLIVASRSRFLIALIPKSRELPLLKRDDAMELFRRQARLGHENDQACNDICELLGDHPQAILLAAPTIWLDGLTLEELRENLARKLVQALDRGAREDELGMHASFALSYGELAAQDERYMFDVCGAFAPSGFSLADIAAISIHPSAECRQLLAGLQNRCLINREEPTSDHYTMHPLLHAFAREKLEQRQERVVGQGTSIDSTVIGKFIIYYTELAKIHKEEYAELEGEHDNLLVAADWAWKTSSWEAVHDLWDALDVWLDSTGEWSSESLLQERAVHANRQLPHHERELADALIGRSTYFELTGRIGAAVTDAEESLRLGRECDDAKTTALALTHLATLYQNHLNQHAKGHVMLEEAWVISQRVPRWIESAYIAYNLAASWWNDGGEADLDQARAWYEKCIALAADTEGSGLEKIRYEAYAVTSIGNLLVERQNYDEARTYLERSRELKSKLGNKYSVAITLDSLATLDRFQGHYDNAIKLHLQSLDIYREIGATAAVLGQLCSLGDVYSDLNDVQRAIEYYISAKAIGEQIEAPSESARILLQLAQAYASAGQYDDAIQAYEARLRILNAYPEWDRLKIGITLSRMGEMYSMQGDLNQARAKLEASRDILTDAADKTELAFTLLRLGQVIAEQGDYEAAVSIYETRISLLKSLPTRDPDRVATTLMAMGQAYQQASQLDEAIRCFNEAKFVYDEAKDIEGPFEALKALLDIYTQKAAPSEVSVVEREIDVRLTHIREQTAQGNDVSGILHAANVYLTSQRPADAESLIRQAEAILDGKTPDESVYERRQVATEYYLVGDSYRTQGAFTKTLELWQRALAVFRQIQDVRTQRIILSNIGKVYISLGDLHQAVIFFEQARAVAPTNVGLGDQLSLLLVIAEISQEIGNEAVMAQARLAARNLLEAQYDQVSQTTDPLLLTKLARYYLGEDQLSEASTILARMEMSLIGRSSQELAGEVGRVYVLLGRAYMRQEAYSDALGTFQKAQQRVVADQDPHYYGIVLHDTASAYRGLQDLSQARAYYHEAAMYKRQAVVKAQGAQALTLRGDLATTLEELANVGRALEDWATADPAISEALQILQHVLDAQESADGRLYEGQRVAQALLIQAMISLAQKKHELAITSLEDAQRLFGAADESGLLDYYQTLHLLAEVYESLNLEAKMAETRIQIQALLDKLADIGRQTQDASLLLAMVALYLEEDQTAQAQEILERIQSIMTSEANALTKKALAGQLARVYDQLGRTYERQLAYADALAAFHKAQQQIVADQDPHYYGVVLYYIASAYRGLKDLPQARAYYREAVVYIRKAAANAQGPQALSVERNLAMTLKALANLCTELEDWAAADPAIGEAVDLLQHVFDTSPAVEESVTALVDALIQRGRVLLDRSMVEPSINDLTRAHTLLVENRAQTNPRSHELWLIVLVLLSSAFSQSQERGREVEMSNNAQELDRLIEEAIRGKEINTLLAVASLYLESNQLEKVREIIEVVDSVMKDSPTPAEYVVVRQVAHTYDQIGRSYEQEEEYKGALDAYLIAKQRLEPVAERDPHYYGIILHDVADAYRELGDLPQAREYYKQAEHFKSKGLGASVTRDRVTTIMTMARLQIALAHDAPDSHQREAELDAGIAHARQAAGLIEQLIATGNQSDTDDPLRLAGALTLEAQILQEKGQPSDAIPLLERAFELLTSNMDIPHVKSEWYALAMILADAYKEAGRTADERHVLKQLDENMPPSTDLPSKIAVSMLFIARDDLSQAQAQLDQVAKTLASSGAPIAGPLVQSLAAAYVRLGRSYKSRKDYQDALVSFQSAKDRIKPSEDPHYYGIVLHYIGDIYLAQKKPDLARDMYKDAINYKARASEIVDQAISIQALAQLELAESNFDEALHLCEAALALLQAIPEQVEPEQMVNLLALVGQIHMHKENFPTAIVYIKRAQEIAEQYPNIGAQTKMELALLYVVAVNAWEEWKKRNEKPEPPSHPPQPEPPRDRSEDISRDTSRNSGISTAQAVMVGALVAMAIIIVWLVVVYVIR